MIHIHPLPTLIPSLHSHFPSFQLVVSREEENGGVSVFHREEEERKASRTRVSNEED